MGELSVRSPITASAHTRNPGARPTRPPPQPTAARRPAAAPWTAPLARWPQCAAASPVAAARTATRPRIGHLGAAAVPAGHARDHGQHQRAQATHGERMQRAQAQCGHAIDQSQAAPARPAPGPRPATKTDAQHGHHAVAQALGQAPERAIHNSAPPAQLPRGDPQAAGPQGAHHRGQHLAHGSAPHQPQQPEGVAAFDER